MAAEGVDSYLIRVPFESLKRVTRERKYAVDEVQALLQEAERAAEAPSTSRDVAAARLDALVEQLQGLKRKLDATSLLEQQDAQRCKARLEHLQTLGAAPKDAHIPWNVRRIDRLLVDHLLRAGHNAAAAKLTETSHIQDLVDTHIFAGAQRVVEALQSHDCSQALAWCEANRARLRKVKSRLEFKLRVQEFVELVRAGRALGAVTYGRQHLAQWAPQFMPELQHAVAVLAFTADTKCERYQQLFNEAGWKELIDLYRQELYRLNCLAPVSLLSIHLQAGLSALKMPPSAAPSTSKEDPLHLPAFRTLAEGVPCSKHVHSKLVCAISKTVMNEHNPPMALPNGSVYSQRALLELAAAHGGRVTCPRSGDTCEVAQLRRVYIS